MDISVVPLALKPLRKVTRDLGPLLKHVVPLGLFPRYFKNFEGKSVP